MMNDGLYARELFRARAIDAGDLRVWMRAPENARVEHIWQLNVARVLRLAGNSFVGIDSRRSLSDDGKFLSCFCHGSPLNRFGSGREHGRDFAIVVAASAEISGQGAACLRFTRFSVFEQQRFSGHDLARRAETALRPVVFDKSLL